MRIEEIEEIEEILYELEEFVINELESEFAFCFTPDYQYFTWGTTLIGDCDYWWETLEIEPVNNKNLSNMIDILFDKDRYELAYLISPLSKEAKDVLKHLEHTLREGVKNIK